MSLKNRLGSLELVSWKNRFGFFGIGELEELFWICKFSLVWFVGFWDGVELIWFIGFGVGEFAESLGFVGKCKF